MDRKITEAVEAVADGTLEVARNVAAEIQEQLAKSAEEATLARYEIENGAPERGVTRLEKIKNDLSSDA